MYVCIHNQPILRSTCRHRFLLSFEKVKLDEWQWRKRILWKGYDSCSYKWQRSSDRIFAYFIACIYVIEFDISQEFLVLWLYHWHFLYCFCETNALITFTVFKRQNTSCLNLTDWIFRCNRIVNVCLVMCIYLKIKMTTAEISLYNNEHRVSIFIFARWWEILVHF